MFIERWIHNKKGQRTISMSAIIVNNWNVTEVNGEPTVKDTDLAERLGFERPRAIRQLIERMVKNGNFGVATPHGNLEKTSQFSPVESIVYELNEKQALKVISKSETKKADEIMDEVIDVFLAFRHGKLQPQLTPQNFTMKAIAEMANSFQGIENQISEVKSDVLELRATSTLDYAQQQKIQKAISIKVSELRINHNLTKDTDRKIFSGIHRNLWQHFEVATYKDIPKVRFLEAMNIIQQSKLKNAI